MLRIRRPFCVSGTTESQSGSDGNRGGWRFDRDEVYPNDSAPPHLLRFANKTSPITLKDNVWQGPQDLSNVVALNGDKDNVRAEGNRREEPAPPAFVELGLPAGVHLLDVEVWTEVATLGGDAPVSYARGEVVVHLDTLYQCAVEVCASGQVPPEHPESWRALDPLADDVRMAPGSVWEGMGPVPP